MTSITASIADVQQLENLLSEPTPRVLEVIKQTPGDFIVLGVGGKMGPTLAKMLKRAGGKSRRVIGVSRFSSGDLAERLRAADIETISADLLDQKQLDRLPDVPNVVYMAGMKFGSTGQEAMTWAMNCYLPGMVCQKYRNSKIVAFSTGNIYGLSPVSKGGSLETDSPAPDGDYAMSCLGRERIFEHFSRTLKVPVSIIRLNYATELRYGVLVDLARRVIAGETIDVSMGHVNVIWQADANAMSICSFDRAASPPFVLNVAGPEMLSVREICLEVGRIVAKEVKFKGAEQSTALLNNGSLGHKLYGLPRVGVQQLIRWTVDWLQRGGAQHGKPTHFEARDGRF